MNKTEKEQIVAELAEKLQSAKATFIVDYRGVTVGKVTTLRADLRKVGVDYRVVKNTLLRLASKGTEAEAMAKVMSGPTAIAIAMEEPVGPAKVLRDFAKANDKFELKGGSLGGKFIDAAGVAALADLPSREELLAKMLGSLSAPASNFVGVLAAIPRSLLNVLKAIEDQKAA